MLSATLPRGERPWALQKKKKEWLEKKEAGEKMPKAPEMSLRFYC